MFALLFTVALDSAAIVLPAPGSYRYEAFVGGKTVGKNSIIVTKTAAGVQLTESAATNLETGDSSAKSTMLLDAGLNLAGYRASYKSLDQSMQADVTVAGREATIAAGTDKRVVALGGSSKGFVVLDAALISGFFVLPAQMRAYANADTTVLVPGTGESAFIDVIPGDKPARPADVPAADESLSFAGEAPFVEWFDPQTMLVDEISLPGQSLTVKRRR